LINGTFCLVDCHLNARAAAEQTRPFGADPRPSCAAANGVAAG